jgi:hypothetical protein
VFDGCTPELEKLAYDVGSEVAKSNSVLITGGLGGVMRAACHGAQEFGGITVGIIPQDDPSYANEFCDIVIPSGMGLTRDFLNALSADGVIVIGGGSGTLSEICAAYMHKKPIVALKNSGGTASKYADGVPPEFFSATIGFLCMYAAQISDNVPEPPPITITPSAESAFKKSRVKPMPEGITISQNSFA